MSATNPQEEKSKPIGLSNKVLFIDYNPTQLVLDIFSLTETPMFKEGVGYYKDPSVEGPKVSKNADLLRFHLGRYYKQFPKDSIYGPSNSNQKGILNNKPITDLISGLGSAPAAAWAPRHLQVGSITPATKLEIAKQYDLTEYAGDRLFSPFHASITKELNSLPAFAAEHQQWILLNYLNREDAPDNAKFNFPGFVPSDDSEPHQFVTWVKYLLSSSDKEGDLHRINTVGLRESRNFTDHAFVYNFPVSKPEITGENSFFKTLHASVNLEYSYYMENYENALAVTTMNIEQYLPNIYILNDIFGRENIEWGVNTNEDYKKIIEAVPGSLVASLASGANIYLEKWSSAFNKNINNFLSAVSNAPDAAPEIFSRARNIIIPPQRVKDLADIRSKKMLFPMSTEIEFTTDANTEFSDFLVKANIWDNLLSEIVDSVSGQGGEYDSKIMMKGYPEQQIIANQNTDSYAPQTQNISTAIFDQTSAKVFNLDKWMSAATIYNYKSVSESAVVLDPDYTNKVGAEGYDHNTLLNTLALKALQAKFNVLKNKNRRPFQDILEGKLCYNETVFYRVAKIDPDTSEVIQNFYFVNSSEADIITYVDTQISYGKNYQYRIYAWQLVFGSEYEYKNVFFKNEPESNTAGQGAVPDIITSNFQELDTGVHDSPVLVDLRLRDSAVLIEVPYYEPSPIRVLDDPPVPPDVQLIPYKNVGDKILMFLSPNTGEYELDPEIIEGSDELALALLRIAKGYDSDGKVRYTTDDHVTRYEVFRTTRKPTSYEDFAGQKIVTLNETTFVDDTITPNTKYYYTFRSVDNHGFTSNPTVVYELEMVQDLDSVYPIIKTHLMDDLKEKNIDKGKTATKTVRKYLHIKPAETQTELNYGKVEDLDEVNTAAEVTPGLGFEDQGLVGKKFKIRLTSKKTGKRLDFNLDFRTSYDMTNIVKK